MSVLHVILTIVATIVLAFTVFAYYDSAEYNTITIDDKWIKYQGGKDRYHVSDMSANVYSIEDSVLFFTFDASNRYAKVDIGGTYYIKTVGWRIPSMSQYQNIIEITDMAGQVRDGQRET